MVIVSWNGRHHLDRCLAAVAAQEGAIDVETILVDNASTDGTVTFVRERFPWVRVVALGENRGFAGGNNAGVREARGEYVALLNNDTIADPGWLRALLGGIDERDRFLLATSRIVYMHDPSVIDSAGDGVFLAGGAFKHQHGVRNGGHETREVFAVCGAACLMPKRVFDELGGFDEDFFFSHEDVDLSYRARLRGYRCRYVATAIIQHHGGGTSGKTSEFAVFHGQRNLEWMYLKNTPASLLLRTLPAHLAYTAAAAGHFARIGCFGAFVRAKFAALAGLPRMWRKRAAVQATRRVETSALVDQMERRWLAAKLREKQFDVGLID